MTQGVWSRLPGLLRAGCAASGESVHDSAQGHLTGAAGHCPHPQVRGGEPDAVGICYKVKWKG